MGKTVKKVRAMTIGYLSHVTRAKNRVKEAFAESGNSSFRAAQSSFDNFLTLHTTFKKSVNNWTESVSQLRVACEVALLEADELAKKDKAETKREKVEKEQKKIVGDEAKVDGITQEMFNLQKVAEEILAGKLEENLLEREREMEKFKEEDQTVRTSTRSPTQETKRKREFKDNTSLRSAIIDNNSSPSDMETWVCTV